MGILVQPFFLKIVMSNEDFDVDSLATYLHLTPTQVERMAGRGKLPGRKIGGQWRFSQAEMHHWFEERIGVSDDEELEQVEKVLQSEDKDVEPGELNFAELMPEEIVFIPLDARTKNSLIQTICARTAESGLLWEPGKMAEAINSREQLHPTALDNGVALLHPRRPMPNILAQPFVALGITPNGIPFGGPRGSLSDIFFLLGSTDDRVHLRVLTRLSRIITLPDTLAKIRASESAKDARNILLTAEAEIDA
jgi:nitrogen PTS system EIIA component